MLILSQRKSIFKEHDFKNVFNISLSRIENEQLRRPETFVELKNSKNKKKTDIQYNKNHPNKKNLTKCNEM